MSRRARVLVIAHGHPERESGGGEIAARALHRTLRASGEFDSVFMARHEDPYPTHQGTAFAGTGTPSEVLFHTALGDRFLFAPADPARLWQHFRDALATIDPDVVHFHHYLHIGLPALGEVRRLARRVPIVVTLHDFQAICHNDGQMMHARTGAPCHRASPEACRDCFPSRSAQDFALRERHVKGWFDMVDRFVAPSRFLAERYIEWGIARSRITVIENLLDPQVDREPAASRAAANVADARAGLDAVHNGVHDAPSLPASSARPLRLAFFGRINAVKGVDLLLEAMAILPRATRDGVHLDIHGAGLERQPIGRRLALRNALRKAGGNVRLRGAYRSSELPGLMRDSDWMIMPSRWWENSPVVILEAKRHALPVICADIGGMAEKIEHGVTGLHFRANDARALAARIEEAIDLGHAGRDRHARAIRGTSRQSADAAAHIALHHEVLDAQTTRGRSTPTVIGLQGKRRGRA